MVVRSIAAIPKLSGVLALSMVAGRSFGVPFADGLGVAVVSPGAVSVLSSIKIS